MFIASVKQNIGLAHGGQSGVKLMNVVWLSSAS